MPAIHVPEGERHDDSCEKWCYHEFPGWLVSVAPDVLWYDVQDVGNYQGVVYGVGRYKGQVLLYQDFYGSCSGCGAWGEGGEPANQEEVLKNSELFPTWMEAIAHVASWGGEGTYDDPPDMKQVSAAIMEVTENPPVGYNPL